MSLNRWHNSYCHADYRSFVRSLDGVWVEDVNLFNGLLCGLNETLETLQMTSRNFHIILDRPFQFVLIVTFPHLAMKDCVQELRTTAIIFGIRINQPHFFPSTYLQIDVLLQ